MAIAIHNVSLANMKSPSIIITGWTESKFVNSLANNFVIFWIRHLVLLRKKCSYDGRFWLRHSWKMTIFLGFEPLTQPMTTLCRSKFGPQELKSGARILKKHEIFFLAHQKCSSKLSNLVKVWWAYVRNWQRYSNLKSQILVLFTLYILSGTLQSGKNNL